MSLPLNISFVITRLVRGGAQRVVLTLLERLDRRAFRMELVTGPDAGAEGSFLPEAERLGVPVRVIPGLVREIRPALDAVALARLFAHFRRTRPSIVHAHTYKAGVVASFAARLAGVPRIVLSPHGHIFEPKARIPGVPDRAWLRAGLRGVTRLAQSCADRILALSEEDLEGQLRHVPAARAKYRVIPNGILMPPAAFAPPSRAAGGGPVLGSVGRLTTEKGHALLLDAAARLAHRLPGLRVRIIGAGPEEHPLRERAAALGLGDRVELVGYRSDVYRELEAVDLYVHPALYEGQGLAILEAMACGRPVAATAVGGVPGVVRNGETGVLVPGADPDALAAAIEGLWRDPDRAARLAANARRYVEERFPVDRMVRAYDALYRELAAGI